jgi:lipoyl(octanoyl) transferase
MAVSTIDHRPSTIESQWLGRKPYAEVWALQKKLQAERIAALEQGRDCPERLLLVEHEPVYTWGKRTKPEHLGDGAEALRNRGADTFEVERGGEVTYHGPGQLVGYPICYLGNLKCGRDLHKYMRGLEEAIIRVLASYGVRGERVGGLTGVWVDGFKIQDSRFKMPPDPILNLESRILNQSKVAALGVRVSKWCTMHGFALNVTDECLPWFDHITPCGIKGRRVTSMQSLLGRAPEMAEVRARVETAFREVLT